MMYAAVELQPDGAIVRHEDTMEVANVQVGDFESMDDAIQQACIELNCTHLHKGTLNQRPWKRRVYGGDHSGAGGGLKPAFSFLFA